MIEDRIRFMKRADFAGSIPQMREALVATLTVGIGFKVGGDDGHGTRSYDELVAYAAALLQTLFDADDEHGARKLATVIVNHVLSEGTKHGSLRQNAAGRWELAPCGKCDACKAAGEAPAGDGIGDPANELPC